MRVVLSSGDVVQDFELLNYGGPSELLMVVHRAHLYLRYTVLADLYQGVLVCL